MSYRIRMSLRENNLISVLHFFDASYRILNICLNVNKYSTNIANPTQNNVCGLYKHNGSSDDVHIKFQISHTGNNSCIVEFFSYL